MSDSSHINDVNIPEPDSSRFLNRLLCIAYASFALAAVAFFFNGIINNPQYDTQVIRYAGELKLYIKHDRLLEYLLMVRKYPLLQTLEFAFLHEIVSFLLNLFGIAKDMHEIVHYHITGRLMSVLFSIGTFFTLSRLSKSLYGKANIAPLLLMSSILFFVFSTAVRPHVPVAFWTLLAYYFSLRLKHKHSMINNIGAFGSAIAAFCTLQNGLFAFIFPLWGYLWGRWTLKRFMVCLLILLISLGISVLLGYTFLINSLLGNALDVGITMGHKLNIGFNPRSILQVLVMLVGSEFFLTFFTVWALVLAARRGEGIRKEIIPIFMYLTVYILVFGFFSNGYPRYYIVTLPFLAILGAPVLLNKKHLELLLLAFIVIIFAKFAYLGFKQNTYQLAGTVAAETKLPVITDIPEGFMTLYKGQYSPKGTLGPRMIIVKRGQNPGLPLADPCFRFDSSHSDQNMFLWTNTNWGLYHIFEAKALGPSLEVYCIQ